MKKAFFECIAVCILFIFEVSAVSETLVPNYPLSESQSKEYQMTYLLIRASKSLSTVSSFGQNIEKLRAVASRINMPTTETITFET